MASPLSPLGWWEFDYYVGTSGTVLVLVCLVRARSTLVAGSSQTRALVLPGVFFIVLSVGKFYRVIHVLGLPLLAAQRVGARLLFVPLIISVTIAAVELQKSLVTRERSLPVRLGILGALVLLGGDLWQHAKLWRVTNMGLMFRPVPLDLSRFYIANRCDPEYVATIALGLAMALGSLVGVAALAIGQLRSRGSGEGQPRERA